MADRAKTPRTVTSDLVKAYVEEYGRLGFGSLTNAETEQWVARVMLFHHMKTMCKARIIALRKRALPLYLALFDAGRKQIPESRADIPELICHNSFGSAFGNDLSNSDQFLVKPLCFPSDS